MNWTRKQDSKSIENKLEGGGFKVEVVLEIQTTKGTLGSYPRGGPI